MKATVQPTVLMVTEILSTGGAVVEYVGPVDSESTASVWKSTSLFVMDVTHDSSSVIISEA